MSEILPADKAGIARAASLLRQGALVAFATETVYGLGVDATNGRAVSALFAAKGRPRFNPLICHYPDADSAFRHVLASEDAMRLARRFWPGPMTLVLPRSDSCPVSALAAAGLPTLAVRVPAHPTARALIEAVGVPVAAPSANRSGAPSPTTAEHVAADLGGAIAAILDSGPCPVGIESTIIDMTVNLPMLLRPGGLALEPLLEVISALSLPPGRPSGTPRAPGRFACHYAPRLPVRLGASSVRANEALLAFGPGLKGAGASFNLSEEADLTEAAMRLFAGLRYLDCEGRRLGLACIAVMPIPDRELGRAINDRLARAAQPRSS